MAQVALNISKLSAPAFIQRANELKTGMTGSVYFPEPDPTVAAVGLLITAAEQKLADAKTKSEAAMQATQDKEDALTAVFTALTAWGAQVQLESKGDAGQIASVNMGVKATPTPGGPLAQVQNLSLTEGDNPGELKSHWDPVPGKSNYEHQICTGDPTVEANWRLASSGRKSSAVHKGLVSGTKTWVRVRAKAPKDANDGPWSQPAAKVVP